MLTPAKSIRQVIVYYPDKIETGTAHRVMIDAPQRPDRLFTLVMHRDPDKAPSLPMPHTTRLVWPNDYSHDWSWSNGALRYGSCPVGGQVWLMMEFDG